MGARGNIQVKQSSGDIWLYTHWDGDKIKEFAAIGLENGRSRWDDEAYLTRILFCALLAPDDLYGTTGYGISTVMLENEYPVVTVDCVHGVVQCNGQLWTFPDFISAFRPSRPKEIN